MREKDRDLYFILIAVVGNLLLTFMLIAELYFNKIYYNKIMFSFGLVWLNFIFVKNYFKIRYSP